MNLIRYQAPESTPWPALDRWSNLRDELNSFFEMPFSSGFGRTSQLFTGWSPAFDLYESGDHFVAVVELPGMRKDVIDISLHDGTLTISGERKQESSNGETAQRTERYVVRTWNTADGRRFRFLAIAGKDRKYIKSMAAPLFHAVPHLSGDASGRVRLNWDRRGSALQVLGRTAHGPMWRAGA